MSVAAGLMLAACGGGDALDTIVTPTPNATTTTAPDSGAGTVTHPGSAAPELTGTSWRVTTYRLPTGSLTNPWPGTELTLRFGDDGTLSGSTGCNDYSGIFEVEGPYDEFVEGVRDENDGQAIRFGALTLTEKACTKASYAEQEAELVELVESARRWFVSRGNLILRTADGSLLIEAQPVE